MENIHTIVNHRIHVEEDKCLFAKETHNVLTGKWNLKKQHKVIDDKKSSELIQTKFGSSDEPDSRKEKDFTLPLCKGHLFDNEQAHIWYMNHLNDILQMHIRTLLQKNFTIYQLD